MTKAILATLGVAFLAGCGVDGAPIKPQYTLTQTIGVNSKTGPFSRTGLHIDLTQTAPLADTTVADADSENTY